MHATEALKEADRLMTICNSCRYCEGLCAVFPAMELRREFGDADLNYLANLCHGCGACYTDCQFSPPHEFAVNVPAVLAKVRNDSYLSYAWPPALKPLFGANGMVVGLLTATCISLFLLGFVGWSAGGEMFAVHAGPGAFYRLMSHNAMALLFGLAFAYALAAMAMGARTFWLGSRPPAISPDDAAMAVSDVTTLRYLGGGGAGCDVDDAGKDRRRLYHHLTFYGFLLCFAATSVATLYHYLLGMEAPYPPYDLPVVLGSVGGIGLIIGPIGLLHQKLRRGAHLGDARAFGMESAFVLLLVATSVTGFALLLARETAAMGVLLAVHLGVVLSLFLLLPYSKMVHGLYRGLALLRSAAERRAHRQQGNTA